MFNQKKQKRFTPLDRFSTATTTQQQKNHGRDKEPIGRMHIGDTISIFLVIGACWFCCTATTQDCERGDSENNIHPKNPPTMELQN
mmetsp:Transcript_1066/g.2401  ORF Transcript_1066/g.2401 Transcript_1066/m.2401 type:complete len:86 (+) Transcript_1066:296-553(+)